MAKSETPEEKAARELTEGIANNIQKLSDAVSDLLDGPLNRAALLVLLANTTKMAKTQISDVLDALQNLKKDYLK